MSKMWTRKSAAELQNQACVNARFTKSPRTATIYALLLAATLTLAWAFGIPGKFSQRPPDPKTWEEVARIGPGYFAVMFGVIFAITYGIQRLSGRPLHLPQRKAHICPQCFIPQHAEERKCSCRVPLEPLENWKWE